MNGIKEAMVESGVRCPVCRGRPHDPSVLWFANEESVERCADAFHSPKREDPSWKVGDRCCATVGNHHQPDCWYAAKVAAGYLAISERRDAIDLAPQMPDQRKPFAAMIAALGEADWSAIPKADPYDPAPNPLTKGGYGFRLCHACSTVVDASVGHECHAIVVRNTEISEEQLAAIRAEPLGIIYSAPDDIAAVLFALRDQLMFRGHMPAPDGRRATIPATNLRAHLAAGGTISGVVLSGAVVEKWGLSSNVRGDATAALLDAEARAELAESVLCALALEHGLERMGTYDLTDEEVARQRANPKWGGWVWAPCEAGECIYCDAARGE